MVGTLKGIALATILGAVPLVAQQQPQPAGLIGQASSDTEMAARGKVDGDAAAQSARTTGWSSAGFGSGLLLHVVGTGVTWAAAANSDVSIPPDRLAVVVERGPVYKQAFETAYADRLAARRKKSALVGGLLGSAAVTLGVVLYKSVESNAY